MKKYEFTGEVKVYEGRVLHRIKRIKDGLIGGWIESEENLSHKDSCFVYDEGMVYDDAKIFDDAVVFGNARVTNNARVYGNAMIYSNAEVCGNVRVCKGRIIGQIYQPYRDIFQYQCENRVLTAILTENGEILYTIGCQKNITKEVFLDRIYNKDGGLENNPHRKEYLKLIPSIEKYFEK